MVTGATRSEVVSASGVREELELEFLALLGTGKAAEARLVRDTKTGTLYVEKAFRTEPGLSRLIRDFTYRACFQAAYPYEVNESAAHAALFRRKVLRELTDFWFGRPVVADSCYTRWDEEERVNVIGVEYIVGYGPRPGEVDYCGIRRLLHNYPLRLYKMATGARWEKWKGVAWEIAETIRCMDMLKDRFRQAGFIGSEWQVDKMVSVSTSNLLKNENGDWILVDLESGFPALPLPRYIWRALRSGLVPLFDDIDFTTLHNYTRENRAQLIATLGDERSQKLYDYVDQLEHHTARWKAGEAAVFRHKHRPIFDSQLRSNIKRGYIECWLRSGKISAERAVQLEESALLLLAYYGFDLARGICSDFDTVARSMERFGVSFTRGVAKALRISYSAFFDERYMRGVAETYVDHEIESWQKKGRLTEQEVDEFRRDMESPDAVEYMQGFVAHLSLQALEPPFVGNAFLIGLAVYLDSPAPLAGIFLSPALRTIYTLYRMVKNRSKNIPYFYAFAVGVMPRMGAGAYVVQMFLTRPGLSLFLGRSQAAQVGARVPLVGGENSRIEHFCIRTVDVFASIQYEVLRITDGIRAMARAIPCRVHNQMCREASPGRHRKSGMPLQVGACCSLSQGANEEEDETRDELTA